MRSLLLGLTLLAACTSEGASPEIASLTYSPESLTVGQQTTITGTFTFDDPDGDLDELGAEVVMPGGARQAFPMTDVRNVATTTEGTITWAMVVVPPAAGAYQLELWVTDADGNASNRLTGTFEVR